MSRALLRRSAAWPVPTVTGIGDFTTSDFYRSTNNVTLCPGDVNGFFCFVALRINSIPPGISYSFGSLIGSGGAGWSCCTEANGLVVFAFDGAGGYRAAASVVAAGDVGKVVVYGLVFDPGAATIRMYRAGVAAGAPTACLGHTPATGANRRAAIGINIYGTQPCSYGSIVGALYGTGVPSAANILAHYNACKVERTMASMPGAVTNVNRWQAQDNNPPAANWADDIGGMVMAKTGTLSAATFAPVWE